MFDFINKKDIEGAVALIDANAIDHTPFPGQQQGLEGFRDIFKMFFTAFPDFNQEIISLIINPEGTQACVLVKMRGTHKGDFMGTPGTGNKFDVLGSDIIYFKNGKATEHWGFIDTDTMMKQLGMMK